MQDGHDIAATRRAARADARLRAIALFDELVSTLVVEHERERGPDVDPIDVGEPLAGRPWRLAASSTALSWMIYLEKTKKSSAEWTHLHERDVALVLELADRHGGRVTLDDRFGLRVAIKGRST